MASHHRWGRRFWAYLADSVIAHPWRWIVFWFVLLGVALPGASQLHTVLQGANGGIEHSEALEAESLLQHRFRFPFAHNYVVVIEHPQYRVGDPAFDESLNQIQTLLEQEPDTQAIQSPENSPEPKLMQSTDGHQAFMVVGQGAAPVEILERRTGELRAKLKPLIIQLQQRYPGLQVWLTGMNSVVYDINAVTSKSTEAAEQRVLWLTLALLLLAFGSLTGACLPILMALFANGIGLGLVYILAQWVPISVYAQTIATMIGLAVGIDYALLMVWRLREEQASQDDLRTALHTTIIQAGHSVFFAGFTFAIGLAGLFFTGITALYSIGVGGVVVVLLSILLSLTLLPALLLVLGPWLNFPQFLSQRLSRFKPSRLWEPLAQRVLKKPWGLGLVTLACVLLLSIPALQLRIGEFDIRNLPTQLESKRGFDRLSQMSLSGVMVPFFAIVEAPKGRSMLDPQGLNHLEELHHELASHPLMARVYSLAGQGEGRKTLHAQLPILHMMMPQIFELFLSQDQQMALVQAVPKRVQDYDALVKYSEHLRQKWGPRLASEGYRFYLGGSAPLTLDYNIASFRHMGKIMWGVIAVTFLILLWALGSYLIALKAILLNLCSVAVSYGVITVIFQWGWLPGISQTSIMAYVPLLLFCIIFGMSIDYEVFLMARIKEEHDRGASNEEATLEGIRATGDVISYAALIMCIVFGAFTLVEISIIKQLGFGLATAILIDATLIRMILVPAFMKVAGRWNWYPGA